jgi:hypothetical protein
MRDPRSVRAWPADCRWFRAQACILTVPKYYVYKSGSDDAYFSKMGYKENPEEDRADKGHWESTDAYLYRSLVSCSGLRSGLSPPTLSLPLRRRLPRPVKGLPPPEAPSRSCRH